MVSEILVEKVRGGHEQVARPDWTEQVGTGLWGLGYRLLGNPGNANLAVEAPATFQRRVTSSGQPHGHPVSIRV